MKQTQQLRTYRASLKKRLREASSAAVAIQAPSLAECAKWQITKE